jgi:hypothetical protein
VREEKSSWLARLAENVHYKHVSDSFVSVFRHRQHNKVRHSFFKILDPKEKIKQRFFKDNYSICSRDYHNYDFDAAEFVAEVAIARWSNGGFIFLIYFSLR